LAIWDHSHSPSHPAIIHVYSIQDGFIPLQADLLQECIFVCYFSVIDLSPISFLSIFSAPQKTSQASYQATSRPPYFDQDLRNTSVSSSRSRDVYVPPAQCPQIDGKGMHSPTPGLMHSTSYSESSGLRPMRSVCWFLKVLWPISGTYGKYRSVLLGSTNILALTPCIAALKSPL